MDEYRYAVWIENEWILVRNGFRLAKFTPRHYALRRIPETRESNTLTQWTCTLIISCISFFFNFKFNIFSFYLNSSSSIIQTRDFNFRKFIDYNNSKNHKSICKRKVSPFFDDSSYRAYRYIREQEHTLQSYDDLCSCRSKFLFRETV